MKLKHSSEMLHTIMRGMAAVAAVAAAAFAMAAASITSPSGNLALTVDTDSLGWPVYSLDYKGETFIAPSRLGLEADETSFGRGYTVTSIDTVTVDRSWEPVWGEYSSVRDHFRELAAHFRADNPAREFTVRFRLFDDGLGFRYELSAQDNVNYLTLRGEDTQFNFTGDHTLFAIPGDYDTDEYLWSETRFSGLADAMNSYRRHSESQRTGELAVQTPLLVKTDSPVYATLHEAALAGYPAMLLDVDTAAHAFKAHLAPDRLGVAAYLQLPFSTPWRTVIVSDDARDILASQLIYNLNEPCKIDDTSWIKPMKFVGV
ncbi:MAG: glycoside hydrolase family 97 N-terminal domain-containing protein, partial [Roseburia sp.]|nr:glycoside hydrolase family 97 N-terminal domain-containing protein [Roseburia sp.]